MIYGVQSYARPTNTYAGSPVDEVRALNETAANQYALSRTAKDELDVLYNNIDVEDRNSDVKRRAVDGLRERFTQLAKDGNFQDAQFAVQDAKKAYLMDNELQAAIQSRASQAKYQGELKSKLDKGLAGEKGGISERQYNYAMTMSSMANKDRTTYDPETMTTKNMFRGYNISDDLSKEISDDMMTKALKFKETGVLNANGQNFQIKNIGGVQKIYSGANEVDFKEVANALKVDLQNNEAYKRYLDESRQIDKFNKTYNPNTKSLRAIDRVQDLGALTDAELEESFVGASKKTIAALEKSGKLDDKATLEEIKTRQRSFDLNDPKVIEYLHDKISEKDQMNKMVYPAAEAASYIKFDDKIFTDEALLEDIRQRNRLALESFKQSAANTGFPPPVSGQSQVNQFTGTDYSKKKEYLGGAENEVKRTKALLDAAPENSTLWKTRDQDYQNALGIFNTAKADIGIFYDQVPEEARTKIKSRISNMLSYTVDENPDKIGMRGKISGPGLEKLIIEAERKGDSETVQALKAARTNIIYGKILGPETLNALSDKLSKDKDYLSIVSTEDTELDNRKLVSFDTTIDNTITEAYNNKSLDQSLRLTSVPATGNIKEDAPLATHFYSVGKNILANAKDLVDQAGIPFDEIISGQGDKKFWSKNSQGKWVEDLPNVKNPSISIASGGKDGVKRISVTFHNAAGQPLVVSDGEPSGEASRPGILLSSHDDNTFNTLYDVAANYAKQTGDEKTYYTLRGERDYGNMFNRVRLGADVDPFKITTPSGGEVTIGFKADGDDASTIIDMDATLQGKQNPNFGKPLFNRLPQAKINSTFRSNEDLVYTLAKYIP